MRTVLACGALCLALCACDWRTFDDLEDTPPVAEFKQPEKLEGGFGVSASMATEDGASSRIILGGSGKNRAAVFAMGSGDDPSVDATDVGGCDQEFGPCYQDERVAGIGSALVAGGTLKTLCFYYGIGIAQTSEREGILGRCFDNTEFTLDVPDPVFDETVEQTKFNDKAEPVVLAADKNPNATLIAGASNQGYAWFYPAESIAPTMLVPPVAEVPESYGAAVAVARLGDDVKLLAVSAPTVSQIWLYRTGDDGTGASPVGCLGGGDEFGRVLATGRVDDDDIDDLVVANATHVFVYSGAALDTLAPAGNVECASTALPAGGLVTSFGCGSYGSVGGCPGGFGDALDVGDLDGDGDGEVIVGAPGFTAREDKRAGAVLVYDVEGDEPFGISDILFVTSREQDDRLGSSVVAAPIDGRDVVVAGAPGNGRAFGFYCSKLVPDALRGDRCK